MRIEEVGKHRLDRGRLIVDPETDGVSFQVHIRTVAGADITYEHVVYYTTEEYGGFWCIQGIPIEDSDQHDKKWIEHVIPWSRVSEIIVRESFPKEEKNQ